MKTETSVKSLAFNALIGLFSRHSEHDFVLTKPFGEGRAKIYDLEKGLQVRFWDFCFFKETELYNTIEQTTENAHYTLAFFLSTEGLQFSYSGRYLPQNAIWDTLFFTNTSPNQMNMAAGAKGHCLGISFSKNWLRNNVFVNKDCFHPLEEKINTVGSLCYHESMNACNKKNVQALMQKVWESPVSTFYIKSSVLRILSDFFFRVREANVHYNERSVYELIAELEKCLNSNVKGSLPNVIQWANGISVSPATLARHFKRKHGVSVSTYFMGKKMEYANQLMQEEGKKMKEVAALVGYANVNNFKTMYQKYISS
jgi:AraC-like DNA-binding protein